MNCAFNFLDLRKLVKHPRSIIEFFSFKAIFPLGLSSFPDHDKLDTCQVELLKVPQKKSFDVMEVSYVVSRPKLKTGKEPLPWLFYNVVACALSISFLLNARRV